MSLNLQRTAAPEQHVARFCSTFGGTAMFYIMLSVNFPESGSS